MWSISKRNILLLTLFLVACASLSTSNIFRRSTQFHCRTVTPPSRARRSRFCSQRPKVIIYNRVPKAGSSTTLALLSRLSKQNQFALVRLPYHNYSKVRSEIEAALLRPGRTLICDHFNFPSIFHGDDIAYINILREPVSRIISQYYYLRYGDRPAVEKNKVLHDRGNMTLDHCIQQDDSHRVKCLGSASSVSVGQSQYFCGRDGGDCSNLKRKELHARAMGNMEMFYSVGVIEHYGAFLQMLEYTYPEFFRGAYALYDGSRVNTAQEKPQYILPNNVSLEYLSRETELDQILYEKAVMQQKLQLQACANFS